MTKVIRAEVYKIFHSFHLWGIALGYLFLNSILVHDHTDEIRHVSDTVFNLFYGRARDCHDRK